MKIEELTIGLEYKMTRVFTDKDVSIFAEISHDDNLIHLNEQYAEKSVFKKRIVHGFLSGAMFSAIIGTKMPGYGSIYLSQNMQFLKPVYLDDLITAVVKVKDLNYEKSLVYLETLSYNERDEIVIKGDALVKLIY